MNKILKIILISAVILLVGGMITLIVSEKRQSKKINETIDYVNGAVYLGLFPSLLDMQNLYAEQNKK